MICSADEQIRVIAAYRAGPDVVEKYGGIPPDETLRAYVTMVLRLYDEYRRERPAVATTPFAHPGNVPITVASPGATQDRSGQLENEAVSATTGSKPQPRSSNEPQLHRPIQ
jgi:hypothetical protein